MILLERWHQLLGIRPGEGRTVGLFFLHNFLLGIGTVLVYVAANVILLENQPERNLPLAYGVASLAMIAAGKIYAHYEHHLPLQHLAVRVLLAVVALTGVLGVLIVMGHSVAAAVAIMAGYRVIYLLTNLEFWGVSAMVFDVRQGKRLFSVISSGDMPAKALGAVLAILIHHHTDLLWLLLTAFGAYLAALFTLQITRRSHLVEARPTARAARQQSVAPMLQRWFGDSRLVLSISLSMLAIAAVTTGVEYSFFVNVKHKFHDQTAVMKYVGNVLVITYLSATLFKLLVSRVALDQVGVRWMLIALPATVLAGLLLFGGLRVGNAGEGMLLLYFCGLYLMMEVLRRAIFDPVFLVLFQPLSPPERLQAHTLAKGLYEPLGMGLAGVLLFALHQVPVLNEWAPFAWMSLFMIGALYFLHRSYGHYLDELQHALSRRFADATETATVQSWTGPVTRAVNGSAQHTAGVSSNTEEISQLLNSLSDKAQRQAATERLVELGAAALPQLTAVLATGTDEALVRRAAQICGRIRLEASRVALLQLAQQPNLLRREVALRALRNFAPNLADSTVYQALIQEELRLAHHLLRGQASTSDATLSHSLDYELTKVQQRLFAVLLQLYPPQIISDAQRGVAHAARERQANALEILDNLIPRHVYQGLQALLDPDTPAHKVRLFERLLSDRSSPPVPILESIVKRGETAFSDWTVSVALSRWHPSAACALALVPHLHSTSPVVRESAFKALQELSGTQPSAYQQLFDNQLITQEQVMNHAATTSRISAAERVAVLKSTALFAETPENVLSSIVPIMKEVTFQAGQQIFAKGDLGTSLFILHDGQVDIFTGTQQLATFHKGDFFGELALLDAEPRSASAVAKSNVMAFRLDQEDFYDVMEERGEVLRNILRVLCQRLRRQNDKMQLPQ
ncbi:cyclic nucleotide-binding domain-containing protein [Hymenobacter jejuensis]|uniref:Cyclic nucleotide-binding domain-containing protein n=1 Tax=Hymenobacter jejuensis TaxID=2502781 RepID=A0A5B7ZUF4_9BACT|nr:cyclic nucleotide-binding domain-containing protein [Hymenobacter jejuensis]QDA58598.1 cyclic nucleotide-binding domain-containing protein [Hymenobacter jejuensis]